MKQIDEVTYQITVNPQCIDCGGRLVEYDLPFFVGGYYVVIPLKCESCGYTQSLRVKIGEVEE